MNDDPTGSKLAAHALRRGMITEEQFQSAKEQQRQLGGSYHLGALLVAKGSLSEGDLQALLREPTNAPPAAGAPTTTRSPPRPLDLEAPTPPPPPPPRSTEPGSAEGPRPRSMAAPKPPPRPAAPPPPPPPPKPAPSTAAPNHAIDLDDELAGFLQSVGVSHSPNSAPSLAGNALARPSDSTPPRAPPASTKPAVSPPVAPRPTPAANAAALKSLDAHLAYALQRGASDLHLHPALPVQVRVNGELLLKDKSVVDAGTLEKLLLAAIPDALRPRFDTTKDIDFTYVAHDGQRARANIYRSQRGLDGVFRLVPRTIPTLGELGLPESIAKFTHFHSGLLLVTGPSASGKTTTLNSLVDLINRERDDHVLTIEDPVEFVHESKRCLVNQRQVNRDTTSFSRALKGALREDPDIIVIGELRDYETISLAITAAETGHLVLGSLHTAYATRTIMRMLDVFPAGERAQVRSMLSESLRAIVAQKLLPGVDGKMHVASEILVMTPAVANLIRDDKMHQLQGAMQMSRQLGSRLMDDSIRELVQKQVVTAEVARAYMIQGNSPSNPNDAAAAR